MIEAASALLFLITIGGFLDRLVGCSAFAPQPHQSRTIRPSCPPLGDLQTQGHNFLRPLAQDRLSAPSSSSSLGSTAGIQLELGTQLMSSTAATAAVVVAQRPFWSLFLSFCLGGLFFSTVLAGFAAVYSFGADNTRRLLSLLTAVTRQVLAEFFQDLALVFVILRTGEVPEDSRLLIPRGGTNRWRTARDAIREAWTRTKRSASEGAEAIRLEAQYVAGAVGQAGLVLIQYCLDRLTPLTLAGITEEAFRETCSAFRDKRIRSVKLKRFDMGNVAPLLEQARFYNVTNDSLAIDVDINWRSDMSAHMSVVTRPLRVVVPVSVQNIRFEGPVRIIISSLRKSAPGYGALLLSFPEAPKIGMDLKVMGSQLTKVPWIKTELIKGVKDALRKEALWPRRIVIPAMSPPKRALPPALSARELEKLHKDDPVLQAERNLRRRFDKEVTDSIITAAPLRNLELVVVDDPAAEEITENGFSQAMSHNNSRPWWKKLIRTE